MATRLAMRVEQFGDGCGGTGPGLSPARRRLLFGATLAATAVAALEATIVAAVAPIIVGELGSFALLGWIFSAYLLAQAVATPICGRLADLHGRKPIFLAGAAVFAAGSLLCGFASSMPMLAVARAIQGAGAGGLVINHAMIGDHYSLTERARMQGWLSAMWAGSALAGPFLGVFLINHIGWPGIFWINLPIVALIMIVIGLWLPEQPAGEKRSIDIAGALLFALAAGTFMFALLDAARLGWSTLSVLFGSFLLLGVFAGQERHASWPLLPRVLWTDRIVRSANLGSFAVGASMVAVSVFLPVYVQGLLGQNLTRTAIAVALTSFGWPIGSVLASYLMVHASYRASAIAGAWVLLVGGVMLIAVDQFMGVCIAAFAIGMGMGLCSSSFSVSAQSAARWETRGVITASTAFMRLVGASVGAAGLGFAFNLVLAMRLPAMADPVGLLMKAQAAGIAASTSLRDSIGTAIDVVFALAAAMALLALLAAYLMPGQRGARHDHGD